MAAAPDETVLQCCASAVCRQFLDEAAPSGAHKHEVYAHIMAHVGAHAAATLTAAQRQALRALQHTAPSSMVLRQNPGGEGALTIQALRARASAM